MDQKKPSGGEEGPGFLDSLARLFRRHEEAPELEPELQRDGGLDALGAEFETAVREMLERVETLRPDAGERLAPEGATGEEHEAAWQRRMAARQNRLEDLRRRIRNDIKQMHERLATGVSGEALDEVTEAMQELQGIVAQGEASHELLPRARHAIAERIRQESGELAVARLRQLLERAQLAWPDPTHYRQGASEEDVERSRSRRLAETREAFLAQGFGSTAERCVGIVTGWGADYPDPGSPLWEECVLEGVGAGIRGQLAHEFVELLRKDSDEILAGIEELIGKEIAELRRVLRAGVTSIAQANQAVASALKAIDLVTPDVAWRHLRARAPHARGEWKG